MTDDEIDALAAKLLDEEDTDAVAEKLMGIIDKYGEEGEGLANKIIDVMEGVRFMEDTVDITGSVAEVADDMGDDADDSKVEAEVNDTDNDGDIDEVTIKETKDTDTGDESHDADLADENSTNNIAKTLGNYRW